MRKKINFKQHDTTDCGSACLASVAAYYDLQLSIAWIRQLARTDKDGTTVLGMIEAAQKMGFEAKGLKGAYGSLSEISKPFIAHMLIKKLYHFVVVYRMTSKYVVIMDPLDGRIRKISCEKFKKEWTGVLILMLPNEGFVRGNFKKSKMRSFIELVRPHKTILFEALFGAIIYSILGLFTSIYIGKITDYVLVDQNTNLLNLMSVAMILLILLRTFIGSMKSILALHTGQKIDASLILGYYKHLLTLPQQFFDSMRIGEIISRVNDAVKIRAFINNVSLDLAVNLLIVVCAVVVMLFYSSVLTLIVLASIPVFICIYLLFNLLNKKYQRKIMEYNAEMQAHLVESLNSVSTIKCFGMEEYANMKTEHRFVNVLRSTFKSIYGAIIANNGIEFISSCVTIVLFWIGSLHVINQNITPGTLMVFYSLSIYLLGPVGRLISANQTIQDALIAADRLFQIMDLEQEDAGEIQNIKLTSNLIGNICFDKVSFRYGFRRTLFDSLSFTIEKGKFTGIVGESGSGKSTLASLLQHLYPIHSGAIYIGDCNITHIENKSLRKMIGVVPQQIELFNGSIIDNIALGDFEPNMDRIIRLNVQLGIHEFIESLPNTYHTIIGEHGVKLSGGERQRIVIARALYRDPEIIIFDEATSSLDSISEMFVKETLTQLTRKGKTLIMIAHRLSTIKDADNILVLDKGALMESGTHQQLKELDGVYSKLWNEQYC